MTRPRVSICIPTYNHCDDLLTPCLDSVIKYTNLDEAEIIVVANGCTDNTKAYLADKPVKLVWFDEALGYTKAANEGIKVAQGEYIVLLNNDTILLEQHRNAWIDILIKPFQDDKKTGVTGSLKLWGPHIQRDFIVFFCVCIKREMFDQFGLLDEIFSPGFGEDMDFCRKVQDGGYAINHVCSADAHTEYVNGVPMLVSTFPIYHSGNKTFNKSAEYAKVVQRNIETLKARYPIQQRVRVVVPAFNAAKTIKRTVDSILEQSYEFKDIIVVDDCSTDNTREILATYGNRITVIANERNEGSCVSRNKALACIASPADALIAYCDADDWWQPTHLKESIEHMFLHNVDMVYSTPQWVKEDYEFVAPTWIDNFDFSTEKLKGNNFIWISTVLHKPGLGTFDPAVMSLEDWDLWIEAVKKGWRIMRKPSSSAYYWVKEGGLAGQSAKVLNVFKEKHKDFLRQAVKLDRALQCDGWMLPSELAWLGHAAQHHRVIVEVGSWHGRSTRVLGDNTEGIVYAIDHFNGSEQEGMHASAKSESGDHAFMEFCKNNLDLMQRGKIVALRGTGFNMINTLKRHGIKADMIFIDAGHTYEEVKADIARCNEILADNGLLCGHDAISWPGVTQAIQECLHTFAVIPETSIWVCKKQDVK